MRARVLPSPSSSSVPAKPGPGRASRGGGGAHGEGQYLFGYPLLHEGLQDRRACCGHQASCWAPSSVPPIPDPLSQTGRARATLSLPDTVPLRPSGHSHRPTLLPHRQSCSGWVESYASIDPSPASQGPGWAVRQVVVLPEGRSVGVAAGRTKAQQAGEKSRRQRAAPGSQLRGV